MRIDQTMNKREIHVIIFSLQKELASLIEDRSHAAFDDIYDDYTNEITEYKALIQKLSDVLYKGDM